MLRTIAAVLVTALICTICAPARLEAQDATWPYQWPVYAPVVDPFRAPANPYAPGNRGIEFSTWPGTTVAAAGAGDVTFAGPVAGALWVTIQHPDGVRTSYGPLASSATSRGARVGRGTTIGTTSTRLHVSARIGNAYVDPAILFGDSGRAHLVPTPSAPPGSPTRPRSNLVM